jgi:hypothetical protein
VTSKVRPVTTVKFSGHETFACRYAWLPKAAKAVSEDASILCSIREDDAMVVLGAGKNMVRSIRFWAEAADVIVSVNGGHEPTEFGQDLLIGTEAAPPLDAYLEDVQTLWLLHWKLSTNLRVQIFAWDFLMNEFHEPELYASAAIRAFQKALPAASRKGISASSLAQLYEVFLHTYVPTRSKKGEVKEDNLDSPFVELDLLRHTGFTQASLHSSRPEAKFAFRWEEKFEIGNSLFAYCLDEFWRNRFSSTETRELTIPLHVVSNGHGSPGQIFKIPEVDIRKRLLAIEEGTQGLFRFDESAAVPAVVRRNSLDNLPLSSVYASEEEYA